MNHRFVFPALFLVVGYAASVFSAYLVYTGQIGQMTPSPAFMVIACCIGLLVSLFLDHYMGWVSKFVLLFLGILALVGSVMFIPGALGYLAGIAELPNGQTVSGVDVPLTVGTTLLFLSSLVGLYSQTRHQSA